jgi:hypothetical protein
VSGVITVPTEPITIELLNRAELERAHVGRPVPLHLLIRCQSAGEPVELRTIASRDPRAELDIDLFERDVRLHHGESYRCTVVARFREPGVYPESLFQVQVGRDGLTVRPRVPTPAVRVVPSMLGELRLEAESICTYDYGTKVDVTVSHAGTTRFDDFRLTAGPMDALHAGMSEQRRPALSRGDSLRFTTVVAADTLELVLNASADGQEVGPVPVRLAVPPVRDPTSAPQFRFLEPRRLTQADVRVFTLDESAERVLPESGVYPVYGGGTKYRIEIRPAHPNAQAVKLRGLSGSVEVTDIPAGSGTWAFQLVVVSNRVLTAPVSLYFDVTTPDGPQQGELNLSIRPESGKLWLVAATAGFAITVKGTAAIVPALVNPGDFFGAMGEALRKVDTLWDLLQFLSIPVIRGGLWLVDRIARPFQEG